MKRAIVAGAITFVAVALFAHTFKKEETRVIKVAPIEDKIKSNDVDSITNAQISTGTTWTTGNISSATIGYPLQFCVTTNNYASNGGIVCSTYGVNNGR